MTGWTLLALLLGAAFGCQGFGQPEEDQAQVEKRESRRHQRRDVIAPLAQESACRRADNKAQPEGRADHAESFRAVLGVGHIGDVGLRHAQVAARDAIDDAAGEQNPQGVGEAEQDEAQERSENGSQQDRSAAEAVGESPEDGSADQLHGGVRGDQQSSHELAGVEGLSVVGQQRQDQAEAQQVDEDH